MINKKIYSLLSLQQKQDGFGFTAKVWRAAATANLRKSCSKNPVFLPVQAEFGETDIYEDNWARSGQNPCSGFLKFVFICLESQPQNCHSLNQRISELADLKIKSSIWKLPWRLKMVNNVITNLLELSLIK